MDIDDFMDAGVTALVIGLGLWTASAIITPLMSALGITQAANQVVNSVGGNGPNQA